MYGFSFQFTMTRLTLIFARNHTCFFFHHLRYIEEDSDLEEVQDEVAQKDNQKKDVED